MSSRKVNPLQFALKLALISTMTFLIGCGDSGESAAAKGPRSLPPPPVTVLQVKAKTIEFSREYAGRIRGAREVDVRARVGGILKQRLYKEGQRVQEGAPLFQIDPQPYEITLNLRKAELATSQAALNQAEREWQRVSKLYQQKALSERERDRTLSELEMAQAQFEVAQARISEAELNIEYTLVKAPIEGIAGLETLSEGSLISAGALLTTLIQQDPVHVRFSLPERDALLQREAQLSAKDRTLPDSQEVSIILPNGEAYPHKGAINFTDSIIDSRTGTVSVRAVFPNPDSVLSPGQFIRVQVALWDYLSSIQIPAAAIGEGRASPQVYILKEDSTVEARPVVLGPVIDGQQIITSGIETGEKVVINGMASLRPGMTVNVVESQAQE
jgi:membrane fusion protein (multidrug efflux system)